MAHYVPTIQAIAFRNKEINTVKLHDLTITYIIIQNKGFYNMFFEIDVYIYRIREVLVYDYLRINEMLPK